MAITLRNVKGSPLTHQEMDENFSALTGSLIAGNGLTGGGLKIDDLTFNVGQGDGIFVSATSVGVNSTVARTGSNTFTGDQVVSSSVYVSGSLFVNSGIVGSNASTFSLVDSGVTTVEFAGSATSIDIGASTGTTNINNNLIVDGTGTVTGDLTVNGGDITSTSSTFNFVTGSVSTLNIGLSATSVEIGSGGGTTSVNNNLVVDGDATIAGKVTAQEFHTEFVSASIIYQSGSTKFGDTVDDIHQMTGTLDVTGSVKVSGNALIQQDLTINGGDVRTSSSTFNFVTSSVSTLNIGLSATSVDIGSTTGITSINNNLDVDGDVNIDGGDLTTNQSTFNLVNTNATTVNIAGAGNSVAIGNSAGTVSVPGNLTVNGNANLGNSSVSDTHVIQGITSVTGSFAVDDIKLDGQQISTFTGNLELNPNKVVDLKSSLTASANDAEINHTGTGYLQVKSTGGVVKVENTIFNGDDVVITGSAAVNAGNITTLSSTGNIFNTNATTLNLAGAGTAINIGAPTGLTTVNNSLLVNGNATLGSSGTNYVDIKGSKISLSGSNTTIEHKAVTGNLRIQSVGGTNNKLILSSSGDINIEQSMTMVNLDTSYQSQGYQSGFAGQGFDINFSDRSSAEFDDLTVRGSLRVFELLINQIRATNGSLFVSSTGKVDQVVSNGTDGAGSASFILIFDTGSGDVGHGFTDNDIIRAQRVNRAALQNVGQTQSLDDNLVFRSDLVVTGIQDLRIITASLITGTTPPTGSFEYVRLGNSTNVNRQGAVYLTADDNYAPFIDVVDGIRNHNDWNNSATNGGVKVRVGKIDGINSPVFGDLTGYGMWASGSVFLEGSVNATSGLIGGWAIYPGYLESNYIKLQSSGSAGGELIAIGQNASMSGNGIFLSGSGDFNIQSHATQFIRKQGSDLRVRSCNFSLEAGDLLLSGSASCGYIGVGTLTNPTTVSNSCKGFFADNGGNVLIKGSTANTNYIKVAGTGCIEIKSTDFDLVSGNLSLIGNAASSLLKLGSLTNATTTGTTNSGFYADNNGNILIKGNSSGKNYIKVAGAGTVDINSDTFDLIGGTTLRLTNSGGGLFTLGDTVYVDADIAISGSGQAKFGNINFDGRNGGSEFTGTTTLNTTGSPGFFLSGSGEFNFVQNTNNYIRKVGTTFALAAENAIFCGSNVSIATQNFDLTGTNLAFNNTRLYLGTIISSGDSTGCGVYMDNAGNFRVFGNSTNYITVGGCSLNISSDSFNLNAGSGDLLISSTNRQISIANGRVVLDGCSLTGAGYIKVGTLTDASTTATTNCGFFADGNGNLLIKGDDSDNNYIKFDTDGGNSALQIKTNNFSVIGGNVSMTGQVSACCGAIGGWTINSSSLTGGAATLASSGNLTLGTNNCVVRLSADDTTYRIWTGHATAASAPFRVTRTGGLTATSAVIKGNICADAGYFNGIVCASGGVFSGQVTAGCGTIGGWTIGANTLTGGTVVLDCSGIIRSATNYTTGNGFYLSSAGTDNFRVGNASGARMQFTGTNLEIYNSSNQKIFSGGATSNLAGWDITATTLSKNNVTLSSAGSISVGTGNTIFKADSNGIYVGNAAFASAPFRVCQNGSLIATSATISGNITATSGTFTGTVNANAGYFTGNICAAGGTFCGTINASCLTAGTIDVGRIAANSLTATQIDVNNLFAEDINFTGQITGTDGTSTLEIDPGSIFIADGTGLTGDIANGNSYNYMQLTQNLQFRYVTTDPDFLGYNICFVPSTGLAATRPGELRFVSTKNAGNNTDLTIGRNTSFESPDGTILANRLAEFNLHLKSNCDLFVGDDLYVSDAACVVGNLGIGGAVTLAGLATQASEATALMINGSNQVGCRELGSNAFNSTTIAVSSYTNPTNDRIITSTGTAGINGEANLRFNGTQLSHSGCLCTVVNAVSYIKTRPNAGSQFTVDVSGGLSLGQGTNSTCNQNIALKFYPRCSTGTQIMNYNKYQSSDITASTDTLVWATGGNPDGTFIMGITGTGNFRISGPTAYKSSGTTWTVFSDERIKTDITPIESSLEKINRLHPVSYRYKPEYACTRQIDASEVHYGFTAQNMEEVFPNEITTSGEQIDESGEGVKSISLHTANVYSIKAIQELNSCIINQQNQICDLINTVNLLKSCLSMN